MAVGDDAVQLLSTLSTALAARAQKIKGWRDYYEGDQPLVFATPEYRQIFGEQYKGFRDNWCAPVADAVPEKLSFVGLKLPRADGTPPTARLESDNDFARIWAENEAPGESSMAWTEASIGKRAYALVWGTGDDDLTPDITFEAADQAIVDYEPGSRRLRRSALKEWQQDEHWTYATLYTRPGLLGADHPAYAWKFQQRTYSRRTADNALILPASVGLGWGGWEVREVAGEQWPLPIAADVVPLIELPNRPRLVGEPISEIEFVAPMQDAINALWSYLFSSADYAALPQRAVLNAEFQKVPVKDASGVPIPGLFKTVEELLEPVHRRRLLAFQSKDGKAEIDQWDPADLEAFTKVIDFAIGHVAAQTRTRLDRFVTGSTIANVSADGLKALNEAAIAKLQERSTYFGAGIRDIAATAYLWLGKPEAAQRARRAVVEWEDFEARSDAAIGDKMLKLKQAGFSFEYIAGQMIKDPGELAEEIARHDAELKAAAAAFDFGAPPTDTGGSQPPAQ